MSKNNVKVYLSIKKDLNLPKKINRLGFYFKLSSKEAVNLAITTIN